MKKANHTNDKGSMPTTTVAVQSKPLTVNQNGKHEDEPSLRKTISAPKPATHAGYLNGLVYRVQNNPEDKDALAELLYAVHDDAALEIYPGKFAEGYTVNESWTAEDTAEVIKTAQRIAAEPLSNCVWPDDSDHTIEAAALRAQVRRLAEAEKFEEPAAQEPGPPDYLDTEAPPSKYEDYPENQPDRVIGERGYQGLHFRDMLDDLNITIDELEAFAKSHNLLWPGVDDTPYTVEWELAMADLAWLYGEETGQCDKEGRMIPADGCQQWTDIQARRGRKG